MRRPTKALRLHLLALSLLLFSFLLGRSNGNAQVSDSPESKVVTALADYYSESAGTSINLEKFFEKTLKFGPQQIAQIPDWRNYSTHKQIATIVASAAIAQPQGDQQILALMSQALSRELPYKTAEEHPDLRPYFSVDTSQHTPVYHISAEEQISAVHSRNSKVIHTLASYFEGFSARQVDMLLIHEHIDPSVREQALFRFKSASARLNYVLAQTAPDLHGKLLMHWIVKTGEVYRTVLEHEAIKPYIARNQEGYKKALTENENLRQQRAGGIPYSKPEPPAGEPGTPGASTKATPKPPRPPAGGGATQVPTVSYEELFISNEHRRPSILSPEQLDNHTVAREQRLRGLTSSPERIGLERLDYVEKEVQKTIRNKTTFRGGGVLFRERILVPDAIPNSARVRGSDIDVQLRNGKTVRLKTALPPPDLARIAYVVTKQQGLAFTENRIHVPGDELLTQEGIGASTFAADPVLYGTKAIRAIYTADRLLGELYYGRRRLPVSDGALFDPPSDRIPNSHLQLIGRLNQGDDSLPTIRRVVNEYSALDCNPLLEMRGGVARVDRTEIVVDAPLLHVSYAPGTVQDGMRRRLTAPESPEGTDADECRRAYPAVQFLEDAPELFFPRYPELQTMFEVIQVVGVLLGVGGETDPAIVTPPILGAPPTGLSVAWTQDAPTLLTACEKGELTATGKATLMAIIRANSSLANAHAWMINEDTLFELVACAGTWGDQQQIIALADARVQDAFSAVIKGSTREADLKRYQWIWRYRRAAVLLQQRSYAQATMQLRALLPTAPNQSLANKVRLALGIAQAGRPGGQKASPANRL